MLLFTVASLLLVACSSPTPGRPAATAPDDRTDSIPWKEIEALYNSREQRTLRNLKYSAYVIMQGEIADDDRVRISRISESYPDHVRDRLARAFGHTAVIQTPTIGSRIIPKAEVFVIFYDDTLEGNIALIFAKRLEYSGKGAFAEGVYLNAIRY